jgi:arylformamidase
MGRLDPDYDNRAAVPRFADFLARWNAASQAARAQAAVSKGGFSQHAYLTQGHFDPSELCDREPSNRERFGPPWGSTRCTIDFFSAAGEGPQPLLVFLHGGYWRSLGPEVFHCIAPAWTSRGTHVAFVGYDLCPSVEIDQIASQCRAAMRWLFAHGDSLGVDLTRVVVSGHSAGGHLAAMLASAPTPDASSRAGDRRTTGTMQLTQSAQSVQAAYNAAVQAEAASRGFSIAGCISLSGVFDLAPLAQTSMNADLRLREAVIAKVSPVYRVPDPALLTNERLALFVGADELQGFHDQHATLIRAWGLNSKAITESLPGLHHFSIVDTLTDPGSRVFQVAEKMLGLAHSAAV